MTFEEIFGQFLKHSKQIKIVFVASCNRKLEPVSAPKMLVSVERPNRLYYIDFRHTRTYANVLKNKKLSVSFSDNAALTAYRLNGVCRFVPAGPVLKRLSRIWKSRLVSYEAERMIERIRGGVSSREAENLLPDDFVIVELTAKEACEIRPGRILRAIEGLPGAPKGK